MRWIDGNDPDFWGALKRFAGSGLAEPAIRERVSAILDAVAREGDAAVLRSIERFEGHSFTAAESLRVPHEVLSAAAEGLSEADRSALEEAIGNVRAFHERGLPGDWEGDNAHGARVGERWYPLRRIGCYIPGGSAPLVSTAVMTLIPAQVAGVRDCAVFTPAQRDGRPHPALMGALHLCGAREVYLIGGAQAIAAAAFGTETIPAVDLICGPGNAYVAEAQRQVFGVAGVPLLPGPSEVMAIVDAAADPEHVAADLLAQAEHGSGAERVFLVGRDKALLQRIEAACRAQLPALQHREAVAAVLDNNALAVHVHSLEQVVEVANCVAPEHLELHLEDAAVEACLAGITTAGAILCGTDTPTVLGDFVAGPSHTLPTARTGRFFSGLKVTDFMRRSSIVRYTAASTARAAAAVARFAAMEGLQAHGRSLELRHPHA